MQNIQNHMHEPDRSANTALVTTPRHVYQTVSSAADLKHPGCSQVLRNRWNACSSYMTRSQKMLEETEAKIGDT